MPSYTRHRTARNFFIDEESRIVYTIIDLYEAHSRQKLQEEKYSGLPQSLCYLQKIFLICGKYSKPTKTSKMNFFAIVIDELQSLTILVKTSS